MRNAREYEKKVKRLLGGAGKAHPPTIASSEDQVRLLIESILQADASRKQVEQTAEGLMKEFVDFNEMRVAPPKEIAECLGRDFPDAREKAETIVRVLNATFDRNGNIGLDYMSKFTKRDLRRHLSELGLGPFPAACVALRLFGIHAVPVDQSLVDCLKMVRCVHPASDIADVQGFMERIVQQKDALGVHEFLRRYVEKNAKALGRKRKADAKAQAKATGRRKPAKPRTEDETEDLDDLPVEAEQAVAEPLPADGPTPKQAGPRRAGTAPVKKEKPAAKQAGADKPARPAGAKVKGPARPSQAHAGKP
jgi:endonuclease III